MTAVCSQEHSDVQQGSEVEVAVCNLVTRLALTSLIVQGIKEQRAQSHLIKPSVSVRPSENKRGNSQEIYVCGLTTANTNRLSVCDWSRLNKGLVGSAVDG